MRRKLPTDFVSSAHESRAIRRSTMWRIPPLRRYSTSTGVSQRHLAMNSMLDPSGLGRRHLAPADGAAGRRRCRSANVSVPSSPRLSAVSPSGNVSGSTPIITRLERWIRSKLVAMTALTPSSNVPLAAQSREEPMP